MRTDIKTNEVMTIKEFADMVEDNYSAEKQISRIAYAIDIMRTHMTLDGRDRVHTFYGLKEYVDLRDFEDQFTRQLNALAEELNMTYIRDSKMPEGIDYPHSDDAEKVYDIIFIPKEETK